MPFPGASDGDESNIGPGPVISAESFDNATAVGISGRLAAGGAPPARPRPAPPPPPGNPPPGGPPPIWPDSVETHSMTDAVTRAILMVFMTLLGKWRADHMSIRAVAVRVGGRKGDR